MAMTTSTPASRLAKRQGRKSLVESSFSDSFLPQNLDDTEKESLQCRRGRKSTHANTCEANTNAAQTAQGRERKTALSNLTEAEKEEHYNFCIKLSTENKITLKNVFNLHLIDYLSELLLKKKEMPNFQMASIALQASSKIFGLRVDYLHSTALHILGNITSKKKHKDDAEKGNLGSGSEGMFENDEEEAQQKKQRAKKKKAKCSIATNINSLDVKQLVTNQMPHKKFLQLTSILEQSSVRRFFCHLPIINDKCQVSLCEPFTYIQEKRPVDIPAGLALPQGIFGLNSTMKNEEPASATLENFTFFHIKWPLQADEDLCPYSETEEVKKLRMAFDKIDSMKNDMPPETHGDALASENMELHDASAMSIGDDNGFDGPDFDEPEPNDGIDAVQLNPQEEPQSNVANDHDSFKSPEREVSSFPACAGTYLPPPPSTPRISVADLSHHITTSCRRTTNLPMMELETLGLKVLRGQYEHLKKSLVHVQEKKGDAKSRPKKSMYMVLEEVNHDDLQKTFLPGKRITLTKAACQRWVKENTSLPQWWGVEDELLSLFKKPYEFSEAKDQMSSDCGSDSPIHDIGADEPIGDLNFDSNSMMDDSNPCMAGNDDIIADDGDVPITLVDAPQKVKRDLISYDKIAKKIDQKLIKTAMWRVLQNKPLPARIDSNRDYSMDFGSDSETSDSEKPVAMKFDTAYNTLRKELPAKISENISVHIAFVILLQLANEHSLFIKSDETMRNVTITSGEG